MSRHLPKPRKDFTGQRFNKLLVLRFYGHSKPSGGRTLWLCRCDCGTEKPFSSSTFRPTSDIKSCGCHRKRLRGPICSISELGRKILFARYQYNATVADHEFKLSFDELSDLINSSCYYCGTPPSQTQKVTLHGKWVDAGFKYTGIDRIDNSQGYIQGNVRPCCQTCNSAKLTKTEEEFKQWFARIFNGDWYNGKGS